MNIKEHILAGHYPTDDKGRALVPCRGSGTVVIYGTDMPGNCPILGVHIDEAGNRVPGSGFGYFADSEFLLPPPPRKVKVTAWTVAKPDGRLSTVLHGSRAEAVAHANTNISYRRVVELTGEYEQGWE